MICLHDSSRLYVAMNSHLTIVPIPLCLVHTSTQQVKLYRPEYYAKPTIPS